MNLVIDTNILSKLCYPKPDANKPVIEKFKEISLSGNYKIFIPEICVYELKRGLLLNKYKAKEPGEKALNRLENLITNIEIVKLESADLNIAAQLWADSRAKGLSTAGDEALDADVILAAQAIKMNAAVVTENVKHLARYTSAKTIFEL